MLFAHKTPGAGTKRGSKSRLANGNAREKTEEASDITVVKVAKAFRYEAYQW